MPSASEIIKIAAIATLTYMAWETLATVGFFDWRIVPEMVAGTVRPKLNQPPATGTATEGA